MKAAGRAPLGSGAMWAGLLLLLAGAFLLYARTFGNAWTLDDFPVVVENPDIRSIRGFFENSHPGRPLRELTFLVDHALFGLNPAGYHIQNIFWHGLNAYLILTLLGRLGMNKAVAWGASLLFLVHPIQVEVVANISHRKDSLSLAISLLALLAYVAACGRQRGRMGWFLGAWLMAAVAWLAKENALVLPVVFLAYESVFVPPERRFLLKRKRLCLLACTLAALGGVAWYTLLGGMDSHLQGMSRGMAKMNLPFSAETPAPYFLMVFKSLIFMFCKLLLPLRLAPEYVFAAPEGWADPWVVAALSGLGVYVLLLCSSFRRSPAAFLALVWMGAFWLPVSNLWHFSYFAADRYLYAPSAGFFMLFALLIDRLLLKRGAWKALTIMVLVGGCSVLTWNQSVIWRSHLTLWTQAVKVSPASTSALNNLGGAYLELGELEKSLEFFQKAAKNFNDPRPYYNLGRVYEKMGEQEQAAFYYRNFLAFNDPKYAGLAMALRRRFLRVYGVALQ